MANREVPCTLPICTLKENLTSLHSAIALHQHWTVNNNDCSVISPVTAASIPSSSDPDCRQRGSQEVGGGAFWKPGQNQTQRVGEELLGVAGVRLQTQSLLILWEQISCWTDTRNTGKL